MKPGDTVVYTSRRGRPMAGTVLQVDPRRPLRKAGVRLGSWTNSFYREMALVKFEHGNKKQAAEWILVSRLEKKEDGTKGPRKRGPA